MIAAVFEVLALNRTRWRRARNLRAGARTAVAAAPAQGTASNAAAARHAWLRMPGPHAWLAAAALLVAAGGAWVIATHARWLAEAGVDAPASRLAVLQPLLPGASFEIPAAPGAYLEAHGATTLLILSGMRAEPARRIDLCAQMADPASGRLLPIRAGWRFDELAGGAAGRSLMLASAPMPHLEIGGAAGAPLSLRWQGDAQWIGDAGGGRPVSGADGRTLLYRQGWMLWQDGALRVLRRDSAACPRAGELVLQLYRPGPAAAPAAALVAAYPAIGEPAELRLAAGRYQVPAVAPVRLEDQQLFEQLREHGLVRLGRSGLAELAPPDLAGWRAAGPTPWDAARLDEAGQHLLQRLYTHADGEFVREQLRIFNGERRLLAWRVRAADLRPGLDAPWEAEAGGVPAPLADDVPAAAVRLFARLPQGWAPWHRVAAWPAGGAAAVPVAVPADAQAAVQADLQAGARSAAQGADAARLRLPLATPARAGDSLQLMLAGRLLGVRGARLAGPPLPSCAGRACATADQVQVIDLQLEPGARELAIEAAPLGMDALVTPGDARYRHLTVRSGQLAWQALPANAAHAAAPALAEVRLSDRKGALLWHDGAPTEAARAAGLATMLGVHADQASGVAGMLGRLPGGRHDARLTLDLGLQAAAQGALDCIGMRRGQWDGRACSGGAGAPEGRQAGLVLLDLETGDILAAAGAGTGKIDGAAWREVRDFDRIDPAASPLRLPTFQHDGGAQRSPGSTFKIVSALGLELAAQRDPRLNALLDGMPLPAINGLARERGFDFRTEAPAYPANGRARITNFRDQGLDRRAQDGRLGLAQALTYSLNTWFAWTGELSDRSLFGAAEGGLPDVQPLAADGLDAVRPIVAMARRLGFGQALRLDGGLLPADYAWSAWDALQATPAGIDPVHTRHELRQMAIGLRMQATPLQMALAAGAVGQGGTVTPRLLSRLDNRAAADVAPRPLGVRLDRIRAGMKGVVDSGTAAGAFRDPALLAARRGLFGKTGTAPTGDGERATVWFTGWLEPGSLPGQAHRLAIAVFVSQSGETGGGRAAPVAAAVLRHLVVESVEMKVK